jgi:recombination protein RecA
MLVVVPPRAQLGRIALKVVSSGAFEVVVIDMDPAAGDGRHMPAQGLARRGKGWAPELLVRKLALAAEPCGTTVILLTDASRTRSAAWPVAMRLELSRPRPERMTVRVAKDKRGRVGLAKTVPFRPVVRVAGWDHGG